MEITQQMRDDAKTYPTSNCDNLQFGNLVTLLEEIKPQRAVAGRKRSTKSKVERILTKKNFKFNGR